MTPFMSLSEINTQLTQLVRNERKLTHEILTYINLFETCGGHLKMGYSSMHQYLTKHLGYSDDQAFRRLKAARLIRQMPEVSNRIQEGSLNLSQAAQAQNAFDLAERTKTTEAPLSEETKKSVIAAIEKKNNFETQQILASSLDLPVKSEEHTRPQADQSVRMQLTLTQQQFEKLKSVKSWLSHQIPNQGTAEVLEYMMDLFLAKKQGGVSKEKHGENSEPSRKKDSAEMKNQGTSSESKNHAQSPKEKREGVRLAPKKQALSQESKTQVVSLEPKRMSLVAESKVEVRVVKASLTQSILSATEPSAPSTGSARILSTPSASSSPSTKLPSTHSTSSERIPLSDATSVVAGHSELVECCDHSNEISEERGSCGYFESTEKNNSQAVNVHPLFTLGDRGEMTEMTFATLETRRQCGTNFAQYSKQDLRQNLQQTAKFKSERESERSPETQSRKSPSPSGFAKTSSRYIPLKTKQEVWMRAGGCCEHKKVDGQRCQSRYQLQFDHIKAHAHGGSNGSDNLQLFCRAHNLWKATEEGIGFDSTPLISLLGN